MTGSPDEVAPWPASPFLNLEENAATPMSWRGVCAWPLSYACVEQVSIERMCREISGRDDWEGFEEATMWLVLALHWELVQQVSASPVPVESRIEHYGQDNGYGEEEGPVGVTVSVVGAVRTSPARGMWSDEATRQRLKDFQGELVLSGWDACQRHGGQGSFGYRLSHADSVEEGLRRNFGTEFLAHWRAALLAPALEGDTSSVRPPRF